MVLRAYAIVLLIMLCIVNAGLAYADTLEHRFLATNPPMPVPNITFEDAKGRVLDLRDFRGHYVLLNLWATWCGPCAREMPALDQVRAHFDPRQLQVVALAEDHDGLAAAQSFYMRHNLNQMPIFVDKPGRIPFLLQARGLPTTLLIDPHGREIGRVEGDVEWSAPDAIVFLEEKTRP